MVKKILLTLALHLNVKGIKGLADFLGENETRLYGWVKNNKIADTGSILAKVPNISIDYLKTGKGPMLIDNQQQADQPEVVEEGEDTADKGEQVELFSNENQPPISTLIQMVVFVIEKDTVYRPALASNVIAFFQAVGGKPKKQEKTGRILLSEILLMTTRVLESQSIYRNALVSNIVAFHRAVEGEIEMGVVKDELAAIREQNTDIMARLARMEEAQQVTPSHPAKKREAV